MNDKEVQNIIKEEEIRQNTILRMIPSECKVSKDVMEALSSVFTQKYAEGYPNGPNNPNGFRYYQGQENTDKIENLCIERAKKVFNLPNDWHVNVQALSGSPANIAVFTALCDIGDIVVGLGLNSGGCYQIWPPLDGDIFEKTANMLEHLQSFDYHLYIIIGDNIKDQAISRDKYNGEPSETTKRRLKYDNL